MENIKKTLRNILLGLTGFIVIYLILDYIGINEIINVIKLVDIPIFVFAIAMYFVMVLVLLYRWKYILKINNYNPTLKNLFLLIMTGQLINNITPSMKGGGEPVRAYYLSKLENIPNSITYASVTVERLLDTVIFLLMSLFVVVYFVIFNLPYATLLVISWLLLAIISLGLLYLVMHNSLLYKLILNIMKLIRVFYKSFEIDEERIKKGTKKFQRNLKFIYYNRKKMILPIIFSFLWWILDIFRVYVLFVALKVNIPFVGVVSTYLISLLVGMLPTLPGGLGASDAVMIGTYSLFGIKPSQAAAGTLLDRFISFILASLIGAICFKIIKDKSDKIKK